MLQENCSWRLADRSQ